MNPRVPWADAQNRVRHWSVMDQREVSASDHEGHAGRFVGHAAVFGQRAWIGSKTWGWWEQIERGAFAVSLRTNQDIKFVRSHDHDKVLASVSGGTLRLTEDEVGLAVDADIANTQDGRDLVVLLARGDLNKMSFGFEPLKWRYEVLEDGSDLYTLTEVRLYEVSTVAWPAYDRTDAGLRAAAFEALCERAGIPSAETGKFIERIRSDEDDPQIDAALRALSGDRSAADPAETSQRRDPAATSRTPVNPLVLATLASRMSLMEARPQ